MNQSSTFVQNSNLPHIVTKTVHDFIRLLSRKLNEKQTLITMEPGNLFNFHFLQSGRKSNLTYFETILASLY